VETTGFLIVIATALCGALIYLRRVNSGGYTKGRNNDAQDLQELRKAYQRNEIEHPRVEAYVEQYMNRLEHVRCEKDRRKSLGDAYIPNQLGQRKSSQGNYAVH
jgi:hypothetical protein